VKELHLTGRQKQQERVSRSTSRDSSLHKMSVDRDQIRQDKLRSSDWQQIILKTNQLQTKK
jgi:hypothetical protein